MTTGKDAAREMMGEVRPVFAQTWAPDPQVWQRRYYKLTGPGETRAYVINQLLAEGLMRLATGASGEAGGLLGALANLAGREFTVSEAALSYLGHIDPSSLQKTEEALRQLLGLGYVAISTRQWRA